MAKIRGKWLRDLGNGYNIWEMAQRYGASLKYLRNGISML